MPCLDADLERCCTQTTDYAGYIRRAFMHEGLMGTVAKLPLERKFKLEHVKEVRRLGCRCSNHFVVCAHLGFAVLHARMSTVRISACKHASISEQSIQE